MPTTGVPRSLSYPEVPVGSILAAGAARWGGRTAFAHGDEKLSFTDILTDRESRNFTDLFSAKIHVGAVFERYR